MIEIPKKITPKDLKIDLVSGKESELFKWFLACLLFGKPIQQSVAKRAYEEFERERLLSAQKILAAGWTALVESLDHGHYTRFDYSTADRLLEVMLELVVRYDGKVSNIIKESRNREELAERLEEFKGIGPVTAAIFTREIRI